MIRLEVVDEIRELFAEGYSKAAIARKLDIDVKTVRKYLDRNVPLPHHKRYEKRGSVLDLYKPIIDEWLGTHQQGWGSKRLTAMMIYDRLTEQYGYTGSYTLVQRYVHLSRSKRIWEKLNK